MPPVEATPDYQLQSTIALEVAERLRRVNHDVLDTNSALLELAVQYEVLAHCLAALDVCGSPKDASTFLQHLLSDLPAYVAELRHRLLPPPTVTFVRPPTSRAH